MGSAQKPDLPVGCARSLTRLLREPKAVVFPALKTQTRRRVSRKQVVRCEQETKVRSHVSFGKCCQGVFVLLACCMCCSFGLLCLCVCLSLSLSFSLSLSLSLFLLNDMSPMSTRMFKMHQWMQRCRMALAQDWLVPDWTTAWSHKECVECD